MGRVVMCWVRWQHGGLQQQYAVEVCTLWCAHSERVPGWQCDALPLPQLSTTASSTTATVGRVQLRCKARVCFHCFRVCVALAVLPCCEAAACVVACMPAQWALPAGHRHAACEQLAGLARTAAWMKPKASHLLLYDAAAGASSDSTTGLMLYALRSLVTGCMHSAVATCWRAVGAALAFECIP